MSMSCETCKLRSMGVVNRCFNHGASPIPQEGEFSSVKEINQISGFSHSAGTCAPQQGACKLTVNVKQGIVEEALIETIGCSGMTQSAAMAAEILPGKTLLEAVNTDLVCDAINVAMREITLALIYGRSQTAFSQNGLEIGSAYDDLGETVRSQVGTSYGSNAKGPRYLELTEGYVTSLGLDETSSIIGYQSIDIGKMMNLIAAGIAVELAYQEAINTYGRYDSAIKCIDPRKE